ncbi:MAG: M20/M25/M40 family metallo-hydrolase, partial [Planctomycetota bacterium]
NVDSEEEGVLTIGCAGGADSLITLPLERTAPTDAGRALSLRLSGLKGGHSGLDIRLQRGNAVQLLARALYAAALEGSFRLAELQGGNAHNAIPREAGATIWIPGEAPDPRATLQRELEAIRDEYRPAEPGLEFTIDEIETPATTIDPTGTEKVLTLVNALPHGVVTMSYEIPELVETSTNLAVVSTDGDGLKIQLSSRSSVASALTALRRKIRAAAALAGASIREDNGYPGWTPNLDSPLLEIVREVHRDVMGQDPEVGAVHAGLECGIIGEKWPGMDMISFGPQIEFPHSPDERVKIDSVSKFYELLTTTLDRLSRA